MAKGLHIYFILKRHNALQHAKQVIYRIYILFYYSICILSVCKHTVIIYITDMTFTIFSPHGESWTGTDTEPDGTQLWLSSCPNALQNLPLVSCAHKQQAGELTQVPSGLI